MKTLTLFFLMTLFIYAKEYDIIVFNDEVKLRGFLKSFDAKGIVVKTQYSDDMMHIKYDKIKQIISFSEFYINDDEGGYFGEFVGLQNGELLLEDSDKRLHRVKPSALYSGVLRSDYEKSFFTRLKYDHPFWQGSFSVGLEAEAGAVYKEKYAYDFNVERRKAPTRIDFTFNMAYETQASAYEAIDKSVTKNEAKGHIAFEYDTSKQQFVYVIPALMFDRVRGIDNRFYPSVGVGHRFYDSKNFRLQVQAGMGVVLENFYAYAYNQYSAFHIAISGQYRFDSGIAINTSFFYMPNISGFAKDWLGNFSTEVAVPIWEMLSFRLKVSETFDSNPAPEVGNNKLEVTSGFRFDFI